MTVILIYQDLKIPLVMVFLEIFVGNIIAITIVEIFMTFTFGRDIQMWFTRKTQLTYSTGSTPP
jgi:hypothetical protein